MRVPRSVLILRLCCLLALIASAALTVDALHTGRKFCPVDAACAKARDSDLGTLFGVKTSVLGMAAFGALFFLTLLPARPARLLGRPAAWAAGVAGLGFVVYQGIVLGTFCSLCLVADLAGLGAAAAAMAWPRPPLQRSKRRRLPTETGAGRLRWALLAHFVVAVPLLWPSPPPAPAWVELPEETRLAIDVASEFAPYLAARPPDVVPDEHAAEDNDTVPGPLPAVPPTLPSIVPESGPTTGLPPLPSAAPPSPLAPSPIPPSQVAPSVPPRPAPPVPSLPREPREPQESRESREIVVVEYLNAYCTHCRATHARLDEVVASFPHRVRRQRIYVWSGKDVPSWARACAIAATVGREDAMFSALLETTRQDERSVRAAAARAGVDLDVADAPEVVARLDRDRRLFLAARLEGLPTFDIGRRRLMGEQSAGELLDALRAAVR